MHPIACTDLFSSLPDEWGEDLRAHIAGLVKSDGRKVVVLDDDPTGTQTVHGIPVLTRWSRESLQAEMAGDQPAFYLLTNSRSMPLPQSLSDRRLVRAGSCRASAATPAVVHADTPDPGGCGPDHRWFPCAQNHTATGGPAVDPAVAHTEIRVSRLLQAVKRGEEIDRVVRRIDDALASGRDIVVYTSRVKPPRSDADAELATGRRISAALTDAVRKIQFSPAFILAKGGITASDIASEGLAASRAVVMGQIWPGVPVWRLGPESRFGEMPYIVFPGNVGEDDALWRVFQKLAPR